MTTAREVGTSVREHREHGLEERREPPGWLLRDPAYRVVEALAPWAALADGASFATLLDDPVDAHLVLTRFPPHALRRSFCGGPDLGQVARAMVREPHRVAARVWVGGYGTPDEGVSAVAVYVRYETSPSDGEAAPSDGEPHAGGCPALRAWLAGPALRHADEDPWPEPDEITLDRTDVRRPGTWWRLRWGPARTPLPRPAVRDGPAGAVVPSCPPGGS